VILRGGRTENCAGEQDREPDPGGKSNAHFYPPSGGAYGAPVPLPILHHFCEGLFSGASVRD
jgi:hypothetical protein